MGENNSLPKRIRVLRKARGLTQGELATLCGWPDQQGRIGNYERGLREPNTADVERLAQALSTTPAFLLFGIEPSISGMVAEANVEGIYAPKRRVPLISWVQAGQWEEAIDVNQVGDGEPITTDLVVGRHAYALRVVGDSMEPDFPEGTILIVDPDVTPANKKFVIVRLERSNGATFKQLMEDGGRRYLKPLNARYPVIELTDDAVFCGVVMEARWARKL